MKKLEKQSIPNLMNLFLMLSSTLKRVGFIKPSPGLYDGEKIVTRTTMDAFLTK